jgi:hypothetical protein
MGAVGRCGREREPRDVAEQFGEASGASGLGGQDVVEAGDLAAADRRQDV